MRAVDHRDVRGPAIGARTTGEFGAVAGQQFGREQALVGDRRFDPRLPRELHYAHQTLEIGTAAPRIHGRTVREQLEGEGEQHATG